MHRYAISTLKHIIAVTKNETVKAMAQAELAKRNIKGVTK